MIQLTAPAVAIIVVVGYLGINSIVNFVGGLFKTDKKNEDEDDK